MNTQTDDQRLDEIKCREEANRRSAQVIDGVEYVCGQCGAADCKLWRPANEVRLTCWKCLEAKGHIVRLHDSQQRSDQIYDSSIETTNYVPAVPDLDGRWWGYTSVPPWWVSWWKALPDKKDDCTVRAAIVWPFQWHPVDVLPPLQRGRHNWSECRLLLWVNQGQSCTGWFPGRCILFDGEQVAEYQPDGWLGKFNVTHWMLIERP